MSSEFWWQNLEKGMLILRTCRPACFDCGTMVQHTAIPSGDRTALMANRAEHEAMLQTAMLTLTRGGSPLRMWGHHHLKFFAFCSHWLSAEDERLHTCQQWALHHSPRGSHCTCTAVSVAGKSPPAEAHRWPQRDWPSWLHLYSSRLVLHLSVCFMTARKSRLSATSERKTWGSCSPSQSQKVYKNE